MPTKRHLSTVTESGTVEGLPSMIVTTGDVDRDFDRVIPDGISFTNFLKNPIMFWGHRQGDLPIATVTRLAHEPRGLRAFWRWIEGDEFVDRVKNAWEQGAVRAASIGFSVHESTPNKSGGRDFTSTELLEISLVGLPANPDAVRTLKSCGLYDDDHHNLDWIPGRMRELARQQVSRDYSRDDVLVIDSEIYDPTIDVLDENERREGVKEAPEQMLLTRLPEMMTQVTWGMFDLNPPPSRRDDFLVFADQADLQRFTEAAVCETVEDAVAQCTGRVL